MTNLRPRAQGDLTFVPTSLPKNSVKVKPLDGKFTLALGEVTGHYHALLEHPDVEVFTSKEMDPAGIANATDVWLRLKSRQQVHHLVGETKTRDHDALWLEPGVYRMNRQFEYVYGSSQRVAD